MIVKIHGRRSRFRSTALYLLRDDGTAERVAWTHTQNLATDNPNMAWRVMAATAMDRDRLRREAGVRAGGRRSDLVAMHLSLSWHADERDGLTPEEMRRAAQGALQALGAEDRQALIVAHDNCEHPHIHLLVNRTDPATGLLLSSSKEKLRLSRWAEKYERDRGAILVPQRVVNNQARARGQFVRAAREKPRHVHELEAANDNRADADRIRAEQRVLDAAMRKRELAARARHVAAWASLDRTRLERAASIREDTRRAGVIARDGVRVRFDPQWLALQAAQQAARLGFEAREEQLLGRVSNAVRQVDWAGIFRGDGDQRRDAFREAFQALSSRGSRAAHLAREQDREQRALQRLQEREEREALRLVREQRVARLLEAAQAYARERQDLIFRHDLENAEIKAQWHQRGIDRTLAWSTALEQSGERQHGHEQGTSQARDLIAEFWAAQGRQQLERGHDLE